MPEFVEAIFIFLKSSNHGKQIGKWLSLDVTACEKQILISLTNMLTQSFSSSSAGTSCRTWLWCLRSCCCRRERRSSLRLSPPSGSRPPRSARGAAGEAGFPTTAAGPAPPPSTCWSRRTRTATGRRGPRLAGRATTRTRRRRRTRPQAPRVRLRPGSCCSRGSGLLRSALRRGLCWAVSFQRGETPRSRAGGSLLLSSPCTQRSPVVVSVRVIWRLMIQCILTLWVVFLLPVCQAVRKEVWSFRWPFLMVCGWVALVGRRQPSSWLVRSRLSFQPFASYCEQQPRNPVCSHFRRLFRGARSHVSTGKSFLIVLASVYSHMTHCLFSEAHRSSAS